MNKEARVGLIVAIICTLLLVLAPTQGKRSPILGTLYKLSFHEVAGLHTGDPVVLGGVPAGRVISLDFAPRQDWVKLNPGQPDVPMVLVTISVDSGFNIPKGTGYRVVSTLKGKHFINMFPGEPGEVHGSGDILTEELSVQKDDKLSATFQQFRSLAVQTEEVRRQFSNADFRRDMKDMASNARFYSREFIDLSTNATKRVEEMARKIDTQERSLLAQAAAMDDRVSRAEVYLKKVIPSARQQLNGYRQQLQAAQGQMDQIYAQSDKFIAQLQTLTDKLDKGPLSKIDAQAISKRAHDLSTKLQDYADLAGDLHTISSDPQVQKDMKAYLTKFKAQSQSLKTTVEQYDSKLDGWKWLMQEEKSHDQD